MTETVSTVPPHVAPPHAPETVAPALVTRPGRWIDNWDPENVEQWENGGGREIARRTLRWSIFAEFLGFVVWQLWSIVAVTLPAAGFDLSTGEIFWLISIPSLVGATLRIPYSFLVPKFGGRNWTIISAARMSGTQIHPASGRFSAAPAPIVMTIGTTNWATDAPRLPPAALRPSAQPFSLCG